MKRLWRRTGFTQYELAVVVLVIAITVVVFLQRALFYHEQAVRAQAQQVIDALSSAVRMQISSLRIKGRETEIPGLIAENPMNQLAQKPPNYIGEFYSAPVWAVSNGNWYFNRSNKILQYNYTVVNYFSKSSKYQLSFSIKSVIINDHSIKQGNDIGSIEIVISDQAVR